MLLQLRTMVPAAFMTHVRHEIVARAGHGRRRLRGAKVPHVEVLDREIDDCWILFAAVLGVSNEALDVHDDVGRQAEEVMSVMLKKKRRDIGRIARGSNHVRLQARDCTALRHDHLVSMYRFASPEISSFSVTPSNLRRRVTRGTCVGSEEARAKRRERSAGS